MRITKYTTKINRETKRNELIKEKSINYSSCNQLNNPELIVKAMNDLLDLQNMAEEYLYLITMNTKCIPTGLFEISHGTVNSCVVTPREIFNQALLIGSVNIILIHNHPAGFNEPSKEDISLTKRIKEAGDLVCVKLLDHIIVGNNCYTSLKEQNLL